MRVFYPALPLWLSQNVPFFKNWGFPGGAVVHGFKPWSGKIPHTAEQLSPCTTTTEPAL